MTEWDITDAAFRPSVASGWYRIMNVLSCSLGSSGVAKRMRVRCQCVSGSRP